MSNDNDNVTRVDFGKDRIEAQRRFARLSGMSERMAQAIVDHPLEFMRVATADVLDLGLLIKRTLERARPAPLFYENDQEVSRYQGFDPIRVPRAEYERMREALAFLEQGRQAFETLAGERRKQVLGKILEEAGFTENGGPIG